MARTSEFYNQNIWVDDARFEYVTLKDPGGSFLSEKKSFPFRLALPKQRDWSEKSDRLLVVVNHVDSTDLRDKRLLSGRAGVTLTNLLREVNRTVKRMVGQTRPFALAAVNFNYCKTYHLEAEDQDTINKLAAKRVKSAISRLRPTHILFLGDEAAQYVMGMSASETVIERGWLRDVDGIYCTHTLDISSVYPSKSQAVMEEDEDDDMGDSADRALVAKANLLGFVMRNMLTLWLDKLPFSIAKVKPNYKLVMDIESFDEMCQIVDMAKAIAVDTETRNLSVYNNTILVIQFAVDSKLGYVVPVDHRDAVWSRKDRKHVVGWLRKFFAQPMPGWSGDDTRYLIMHNAPFDLRILRRFLRLPVIYWPVWDTMSGEYLLDENIAATENFGAEYGKLSGLCSLYGSDFYYTKEGFSKEDRSNIEESSLEDTTFLEYCAFDVVSIHAIHRQQQRIAASQQGNYLEDYRRFCLTQMSAIVHDFSHMVEKGVPTDVDYLVKLLSPNSPINETLRKLALGFRDIDSVKKANKQLAADVQTNGLFGKVNPWVFDPDKPEHIQHWFFTTLALDPVAYTKTGASTGKALQTAYKDIPDVAHFTRYRKIKHVKTAFVSPFYKHVVNSEDGKLDYRIRPGYGFWRVVTGRSNSFSPSLQQVPQRTEEAKLLKKAFVAGKKGEKRVVIKLDFNTHEVRGWAIAAVDKRLGERFVVGRRMRQQYMETEDESLPKQIKLLDLHRQNVALFWAMNIAEADPKVVEDYRDQVKAIVFGSIYGRSVASIARALGKTVEETQKVYDMFFSTYKKGGEWLEKTQHNALQSMMAVSPITRRRNLYGYLTGSQAIIAANSRQAINSPIQGFGADIAHLASRLYTLELVKLYETFGWEVNIDDFENIEVMVHDSSRTSAAIEKSLACTQLLNWVYTTGVEKYMLETFDLRLVCPLEVEFEIGCNDAALSKWDWSMSGLKKILVKALQDNEVADAEDVVNTYWHTWGKSKEKKYMDKHYPWFEWVNGDNYGKHFAE